MALSFGRSGKAHLEQDNDLTGLFPFGCHATWTKPSKNAHAPSDIRRRAKITSGIEMILRPEACTERYPLVDAP